MVVDLWLQMKILVWYILHTYTVWIVKFLTFIDKNDNSKIVRFRNVDIICFDNAENKNKKKY